MAREIVRRPQARLDLIEIWGFIADDSEAAADRMLDRIDEVLRMLRDRPLAGRARPELLPELRSFPVGSYVVFYLPLPNGIDLVRVRSGYLDIGPNDFDI
ncbi:MAG TPA: type II toxin-antitoxin system RelE/ParE family toxin [Xanthobacteraceae bacterium]|jgi:toxin ParE1/3/4|nr:type II toxin-antitoxin system RelE/ParE family toxin [Xanthobacteraceae bacterium]